MDEIHLLTSDEIAPKATVRNVESALMAQLGMRVSHKKISVATTRDTGKRTSGETPQVREREVDAGGGFSPAAAVFRGYRGASEPEPGRDLSGDSKEG